MSTLRKWRNSSPNLRPEIVAMFLAFRDSRTPWFAKVLAVAIVGYTFSPIDLIPDPVPILGYLDDLVILPLGIIAVRRTIPVHVFAEARLKAARALRPLNRIRAAVNALLWGLAALLLAWLIYTFSRQVG
jgi:uncharacterized membrane protein YkvA (DUF1232 family)